MSGALGAPDAPAHPALGWASPALLALAAALAWFGPARDAGLIMSVAILWAGAVLAFQAGVRRGVSFLPGEGGWSGLLLCLVIFVLAILGMVARDPRQSFAVLILGFTLVGLLARRDRRKSGPAFRAPLQRLGQAALSAASLLAMAARLT